MIKKLYNKLIMKIVVFNNRHVKETIDSLTEEYEKELGKKVVDLKGIDFCKKWITKFEKRYIYVNGNIYI